MTNVNEYQKGARAISIDWLSVYGRFDLSVNPARALNRKYQTVDNQRGTPMFQKWYSVFSKSKHLIAQVCCIPFSVKSQGGIFYENAMTIQMSNRMCYDNRLFEVLADIAESLKFKVLSVSRLDLCIDFHKFDNQMKPKTLIRGFYSGTYLKKGYAKAFGVGEQFTEYHPSTISFRGKNSAIGVKLYNKSEEQREVKEKPYIQDVWRSVGLLDKEDVWRLEFSIKSDGRTFVNLKDGEFIKFGLKDIQDIKYRFEILAACVRHKFEFRYAEPGKKMTMLKKVELFKFKESEELYKPIKVTESHDLSRRAKMLRNAVNEVLEDVRATPEEIKKMEDAMWILNKYYRVLPNINNLTKKEK